MKKVLYVGIAIILIASFCILYRVRTARSTGSSEPIVRTERADDSLTCTSSSNDGVSQNVGKVRRQRSVVTAYNSTSGQTDSTPCLGAAGFDICFMRDHGIDVCASNDYPFGTRLYVDGLGFCTVWDRMNKRYTGKARVDWFMGNDVIEAQLFGNQIKEVAIYP